METEVIERVFGDVSLLTGRDLSSVSVKGVSEAGGDQAESVD